MLILPSALRAQIEGEARAAFPRECCGLIEGEQDGAIITATALHAARNLSEDGDRFEIDPADHLRAQRGVRERGQAIVGCYHSHPNGGAEPSARDLAGASEEGFVWVIAWGSAEVRLAAFLYGAGGFSPMEISHSLLA